MSDLLPALKVQGRVIHALLVREMSTRFGRDNIGFLWIMVEPLLFAVLVGIMYRAMRGPEDHGVSVFAFVVSGYIPLVMFRHAISRSVMLFTVNGALMYHRQIKIYDFIFARFIIECVGHLMAYIFIGIVLGVLGLFPFPADPGILLLGYFYYSIFTLGVCFVLTPLSEVSEFVEKLIPVTTYIMVPFSGTFYIVSWLTPTAQDVLYYAPPVHAMEMMRYGLFGDAIVPTYDFVYPLAFSVICMLIGLMLCRLVRRDLVVE